MRNMRGLMVQKKRPKLVHKIKEQLNPVAVDFEIIRHFIRLFHQKQFWMCFTNLHKHG